MFYVSKVTKDNGLRSEEEDYLQRYELSVKCKFNLKACLLKAWPPFLYDIYDICED